MRTDLLAGFDGNNLYPANSIHQQEIEAHFGEHLLRPLSPEETALLGSLDIFFVVFTNRCGSTYLTEMMHQLGLGIPPRAEVLNSDEVINTAKTHDIPTFTEYLLRFSAGWQRDGVLGVKSSARQLFWLTRTGLLSHFRTVRVIHNFRHDRLGQAVSYYKAMHTGRWHSEMKGSDSATPEAPPYDREQIMRCLFSINNGLQLAQYYGAIHNPPTLAIAYEDLLSNPQHQMQRLGDFLGVTDLATRALDTDAIEIRQQRDSTNTELRTQFEAEFFFQP